MPQKPTYEDLEKRVKGLETEIRALSKRKAIEVSGIIIEWDIKSGTCSFEGLPVAMMWVDTTLSGLMSGIHQMVGSKRFSLALQSEGRKSVEEDWDIISRFPNFKEGINAIAKIAAVAGWGNWKLVSVDAENKECFFQVRNSWEGRQQKSQGVCWGSGMLAGKFAGYCSKLFSTNCWAEQIRFIAKGDEFDEFVVKPSNRSIETEIDSLLATDEATRADMAVAIQNLKKEADERNKAERALQQSEEKYRGIFDESVAAIYLFDNQTNFLDSNQAGIDLLGYSKEELLGMSILDIDADPVFVLPAHEQLLSGDRIINYEHQLKRKDGGVITVLNSSRPVRDENGNVIGKQSTLVDITEHRNAEQAFRSESRRRTILMDASRDGIAIINQDHKVVEANRRFAEMLGYTMEEVLHLHTWDFEATMTESHIRSAFKDLTQTNATFQTQHRRKDGSVYDVEVCASGALVFDEPMVLTISRDITDRKLAEEALKKSEELLRATIESTADGVLVVDEKGRVTHLNKRFAQMWHIPGDIIRTREDKKLLDFVLDQLKDPEAFLSKVQALYKTPDEDFDLIYFKDSRIFERFSSPLVREDRITGRVWSFRDITDRKKTEEALNESEEKYRLLTELLPMAIFEIDHQGNITFANKSALQSTGFTQEDINNGLNILQVTAPQEHDRVLRMSQQVKQGEFSDGSEYIIQRKDGSIYPSFINTRPSRSTSPGLIGYIFDLTSLKEAEKALRESEEKLARSKKMESLGLLAGGVAHDLNNVLAGIVSYPELLLLDLPEDSQLRKPIEIMRESGHRATAIVQDLLTVARGVATTKEPLNINDLIGDYLNSPEFKKLEQFHPTVSVKTILDTDLHSITGSYVHIRKAVMNLVSNASEAIVGSGNVTISTTNSYIDRPLKGYDDVSIGEYVVLSVSDDGAGISSDDLERIFEPFYTKKVMGRSGTGLGLAVVWNVVQDHKGYIDVISGGHGTTFELYFPITRETKSDQGLHIAIEDYKGSGETILVIDDVESQREIACNMLNVLGYEANAVSSGEEAVEYLKEHAVDLILLDMIMDPGINGLETYERIIQIHPNQKAIIASGFAETDDVKQAQKLGAGSYIKKPITLEEIGLAVKKELEK